MHMKSSQEQCRRVTDPLILLLLAIGGFLVLPCVFAAVLARWLPYRLAGERRVAACPAALRRGRDRGDLPPGPSSIHASGKTPPTFQPDVPSGKERPHPDAGTP